MRSKPLFSLATGGSLAFSNMASASSRYASLPPHLREHRIESPSTAYSSVPVGRGDNASGTHLGGHDIFIPETITLADSSEVVYEVPEQGREFEVNQTVLLTALPFLLANSIAVNCKV